ncbi:hypothetical protein CCYA_CCYA05G1623 [Cyanidiococcus yangmingshanensis]|nr:hypothetical protein CCYA_CCYA05G1623 [Cyanidiococcus yangmingshanensis]
MHDLAWVCPCLAWGSRESQEAPLPVSAPSRLQTNRFKSQEFSCGRALVWVVRQRTTRRVSVKNEGESALRARNLVSASFWSEFGYSVEKRSVSDWRAHRHPDVKRCQRLVQSAGLRPNLLVSAPLEFNRHRVETDGTLTRGTLYGKSSDTQEVVAVGLDERAVAPEQSQSIRVIRVETALVPRPEDALVPYTSPLILVPSPQTNRWDTHLHRSCIWRSPVLLLFLIAGSVLAVATVHRARRERDLHDRLLRWSRELVGVIMQMTQSAYLVIARAACQVVTRTAQTLRKRFGSGAVTGVWLRRRRRRRVTVNTSSSIESETKRSSMTSAELVTPNSTALVLRILQNFGALARLQTLYGMARARALAIQGRDLFAQNLANVSAYLEVQLSRLGDERRAETDAVTIGVETLWSRWQQFWNGWTRWRDDTGQANELESWDAVEANFRRKLDEICERNMRELERKLEGDNEAEVEAVLRKYASLSWLFEPPTEEASLAYERATPEQRYAVIEKMVEELGAARAALAPFLEQGLDPESSEAESWIQAAERSGITGLRSRLVDGRLRRELAQLFTGGYDWDGEIYTAETEGSMRWKAALERLKKREDVAVRLQQRIQSMRPSTDLPLSSTSSSKRPGDDTLTKDTDAPPPQKSLADELKLVREELSVMSDEELLTWIRRNAREVVRSGLAEKVLGRLALATIAGYILVNLVIKNDVVQQLEQIRPYAERIVRFFIL